MVTNVPNFDLVLVLMVNSYEEMLSSGNADSPNDKADINKI